MEQYIKTPTKSIKKEKGLTPLRHLTVKWSFLNKEQPIFSYLHQRNESPYCSGQTTPSKFFGSSSRKVIEESNSHLYLGEYINLSSNANSMQLNRLNQNFDADEKINDNQQSQSPIDQIVNKLILDIDVKRKQNSDLNSMILDFMKKERRKHHQAYRSDVDQKEVENIQVNTQAKRSSKNMLIDQAKYLKPSKIKDLTFQQLTNDVVFDKPKLPTKFLECTLPLLENMSNSQQRNLEIENQPQYLKVAQSNHFKNDYINKLYQTPSPKKVKYADIIMDLYENSLNQTQLSRFQSEATKLSSTNTSRFVKMAKDQIKKSKGEKETKRELIRILKPTFEVQQLDDDPKLTKDKLRDKYDGWFLKPQQKLKRYNRYQLKQKQRQLKQMNGNIQIYENSQQTQQ